MAWRIGLGVGRALMALVLVCVAVQPATARAVIPGRNGLLLLAAPEGTAFSGADAAPMARVADCYQGLPNALWTVRPGGGGVASVGKGDSGQFSPNGRMLVSSYSPGCYNGNALSLSRMPFHSERPIRDADYIDAGSDVSLGPWLGPEDPTFLDPNGTYRDGITGRPLIRGSTSAAPMSCSGRVANPNGTIGTPVRASGHVVVLWRRIRGHGWLGNESETTVQWSPDGRYVYFSTWSRHSDRLWRVDSDGGGRRLLFRAPASADLLSQLSPNGRWILMTTLDGRFGERLSVLNIDGHKLHTVTPPPAGGNISATAEWSPRGDLLLVDGEVSYYSNSPPYATTGPSFIYVVRAGGGPRRDLTLPGLGIWSPDERFIAYVAYGATPESQSQFTQAKLVISSVSAGLARTVLTAAVPTDPPASTIGTLSVSDWQAAPGSARLTRCADGRAPF